MYRAVVFDFDGTIIDTEKHLFDVINKHLVKHNEAPISLAFYRRSIGGAATELHQRRKQQYIKNIMIQVANFRSLKRLEI